MTPKEKSIELIEKYLPEVRGADRYNYNLEDMNFFIAKRCAMIAVDEIINEPAYADSGSTYWQQVKQEIKNL